MIAAVEGGVHNGRTLTAADVAAISGCTEEELEKYFHGTSRYLGYSMHDIQGNLWELKDGMDQMKNKYFVTPVITISMGKLGVASRLCGEVFGSAMTFASAGDSSAPGQISIDVVNAVLDSITE